VKSPRPRINFAIAAWGAASLFLFFGPLARAQQLPVTSTTLVPALGWDIKKQGGFPVSLASDVAGNIWVGTEGNGVWKYDAGKKTWTQFTTNDGLGDNCVYALAFDHLGRLWAGHLNHGVSVYNGDKWRNYGMLEGPLGDRVFAITVSPKDGDVWIATDMGIACYSEERQDWDYYTRASGLPSDQIQGLAFDDKDNLYAGTQCDGIAIAGPDDDYTKWTVVTAPSHLPPDPRGAGLASDLINGMQTNNTNRNVFAFTPFGGAVNTASEGWKFVRGLDWKDHTPGPYGSVDDIASSDPAEDWITAAASNSSQVAMGYRKAGVEFVDVRAPVFRDTRANVPKPATVLVRSILLPPNQPPLVAAYDPMAGGLLTLANSPSVSATTGTTAALPSTFPPLPAPVPPPALADAQTLGLRLGKLTEQLNPGEAYYLADDWRTEGDWIGRYGNGFAKLCGIAGGDQDYSLLPGYKVSIQVGPHHDPNVMGPVAYHDNESSDDPRSLYDPTLGHRRDGEENDFSYDASTYPESYDGPGLWVRVTVPDGVHCLSLYFLNNDAHDKSVNKYRDYEVEVLSGSGDDAKINASTPLARSRVTDFWGGVYKQFLLCGPADYVVRIDRNRSFVTKLQAVFLDSITGDAPQGRLPGFDTVPYNPPTEPDDYHPTPITEAAVTLWHRLDDALSVRGAIPLQMPLRIWCYRAAVAGQAPAGLLELWRWQISIWTPDDRQKFDAAVKAAFDSVK
jgi:hypothetical protein